MASTLGTLTAAVSVKLGDKFVGEFYSSTEIKAALGDAYRHYTQYLAGLGQGYFETPVLLDITANSESIDISTLSPPFWIVSHLWRQVTYGFYPLRQSEQRFNANYTLGSGTGDAYIPTYRLRGLNIVLSPPPLFSQTGALKLEYVYQPTFPTGSSADAFTFDGNFPVIYEANVRQRACVKLLESKDAIGGVSDIQSFRADLEQMDQQMINTMTPDEFPDSVTYMGRDYRNIY
jgi:hypothetical protein